MPSAENERLPLIGTWRLVTTEQRLDVGTVRPNPIYRPTGVGYLIYGSTGHICALLMNPHRPHWLSEDEPTPQEMKSALDGFVAYCGSYEVNEAEGFVLHHVEIDAVPKWAGTGLKRIFVLSGNRLTLRPAPPILVGVIDYTLTWERA